MRNIESYKSMQTKIAGICSIARCTVENVCFPLPLTETPNSTIDTLKANTNEVIANYKKLSYTISAFVRPSLSSIRKSGQFRTSMGQITICTSRLPKTRNNRVVQQFKKYLTVSLITESPTIRTQHEQPQRNFASQLFFFLTC